MLLDDDKGELLAEVLIETEPILRLAREQNLNEQMTEVKVKKRRG